MMSVGSAPASDLAGTPGIRPQANLKEEKKLRFGFGELEQLAPKAPNLPHTRCNQSSGTALLPSPRHHVIVVLWTFGLENLGIGLVPRIRLSHGAFWTFYCSV